MKILAIRGKNMASLEGEFIIDFRSEPLKSAGIFAITGSTGSGKSTLLDTMCIALFEKSPRIKKITDSTKVPDTQNTSIHENDPRNILRRGCSNGYAECDFLALDGKEYRVRWSVRRADNKPNGRLQNTTYSLLCLNDNSEIPGTKTELLRKVTELLGLTFDQFSRAVLLAQGDFATFLKASSREKSEILEKLTGTDLYSHISINIFNKSKEADNALAQIAGKIDEITLLSDEELKALNSEQESLQSEKSKAQSCEKAVEKSIEWIERMAQLASEEKSAAVAVERMQAELTTLAPTISRLKEIDNVQPIRDTYTNILSLKKQIKESDEQLRLLNKQVTEESGRYTTAEKELAALIGQQNSINDEWNKKEPRIREAQKIESERELHKKQLMQSKTAVENDKNLLAACQKRVQTVTAQIETKRREIISITEWQKNHELQHSVVPNIESIIQDINEVTESQTLITEKKRLEETATTLLQGYEQQLIMAQKESERLSSTLTQEIATLRSQLVEGEPCPVCGSTHHRVSTVEGNVLQEELLLKAKKENQSAIKHLTESIEKCRIETAALATSIDGYNRIYNNKLQRVTEQLQPLLTQQETTLLELKSITDDVKTVAKEWKDKEQQKSIFEREISADSASVIATESRIGELISAIKEGENNCKALIEIIAAQEQKITELLGCNESTEVIEKRVREQIKEINNKVTLGIEKRNTLLIKVEKSRQQIDTLQRNIQQAGIEFDKHKQQIEAFLESQGQKMLLEELHRLATVPVPEITRMRAAIEEAENRLLAAKTMLAERSRNVMQHQGADTRPDENDTKEILIEKLTIYRDAIAKHNQRLTQIAIILNNDKENKTKTVELRKRHEECKKVATDWSKLNMLLGSSDGNKFRMIAQGYTLDIMLAYANRHLKELTDRYELARISPDSLAIKVIDLDMLSESRSVHSLSGGESFLVSLALALALSSLSSNKMSIESLFIDEGFGSLDSEVLGVAMDALERLQNQGRKIGVISHLSDMIERIPTQICVKRSKEGKSSIRIKG